MKKTMLTLRQNDLINHLIDLKKRYSNTSDMHRNAYYG